MKGFRKMLGRPAVLFGALGLIVLAGSGVTTVAEECPAEFGLPADTVCDLTGEICTSGYEVIDGSTYCVMQGRLQMDEALEMDDEYGDEPMDGNDLSVADANVFEADPGCVPPGDPPCNDPDLPNIPGATYIDWNDLYAGVRAGGIVDATSLNLFATGRPIGTVENYRITDFTANEDYNIFATGNCVGDGSSVPKEDFTQSYLANNDDYLYFAQERRTNSGNSVYYWMLTQEPAKIVASSACGSNTRGELQFTLTAGDAQVIVNFPSSSNPAAGAIFLRTYAGATQTLPADEAVFADPLVLPGGWVTADTPVENFALTIGPRRGAEADDTRPDWGGFDSQGKAFAQDGEQVYETAEMAEWAVNFDLLFQGGAVCGERRFITGVSRSATGQTGSVTEPADLKDLVGPKLYSFGEITASATLTPLCDPGESFDYTFDFSASGTDIMQQPIDPSDLSCVWDCTSTVCSDPDLTFDAGTTCSGTGSIPRAEGTTDAQPCDVSCSVTVTQISSQCTDDSGDDDDVVAPLIVDIAAAPDTRTCTVPGTPGSDPGDIGQGITYDSTVSGGDQPYSYSWLVSGSTVSCGDSPMCNVNFAATDFCARASLMVTVSDVSICPDADSEPETVMKSTQMSGSNNTD